MPDSIGQAYVQILPTTKNFGKNLSAELGSGNQLTSAGKSMGGKILAGVASLGIGTLIVKGISDSIKNGGELQQSLGGVEALFKDSADKVKQNAENSYSTVGISANKYMEQVTSFSASLLQGLNGDTKKAANIADIAMKDMGDNVNRFGTDVESVQQAYQAFVKGNYATLDNLKLGYGGTKTEMLRLLKDTGVVEKSTKNLDNVTFDQMILGIHKVQEELGVTGTTAKEASTTLQGSLASFKALGQDLLGNLAIGADITPQLESLITTSETFLTKNLLPMVGNVINGLANNSEQLGTSAVAIVTKIGGEIIKEAPTLMKSGLQLGVTMIKGLADSAPQLTPDIVKTVAEIAETLTEPETLSSLIDAAVDLTFGIAEGLLAPESIKTLEDAGVNAVINIGKALIKSAPNLLNAGKSLLSTIVDGLKMKYNLGEEAMSYFGKMLKNKFNESIDSAKQWGSDLLDNFIEGLKKRIRHLKDSLKNVGQTIKDYIGFSEPRLGPLSNFHTYAPDMIDLFCEGIAKNQNKIAYALDDVLGISPLLTASNISMDMASIDGVSAMDYRAIYEAVRQGASESRPIIMINDRVLTRELKGMGVSFA